MLQLDSMPLGYFCRFKLRVSLGTIGAQKDGTSVEGGQYRSLVPNVNAVNAMHWFVKTESLWLFVLIILLLREKN